LAYLFVGGVAGVFNIGVCHLVLVVFLYVVEMFTAGGVIVCVVYLLLFVADGGTGSIFIVGGVIVISVIVASVIVGLCCS